MSEPGTHVSRRDLLRIVARRSAAVAGAFTCGLVVDAAWARAVRGVRLERDPYRGIVFGSYRVHHNVAGYLLIALGLFRYPVVLVPLGLGMIVGHRMRDRLFWFIERVE